MTETERAFNDALNKGDTHNVRDLVVALMLLTPKQEVQLNNLLEMFFIAGVLHADKANMEMLRKLNSDRV